MENAVEALKIAGWMLIFIVALSFSMNALTFVKQNIDSILTYEDREYLTKYVEGNKTTDSDGTITYTTERLVGIESILPTIYRAFEEDLVINFDFNKPLYTFKSTTKGSSVDEEVYKLDSRNINLSKESDGKYIEMFIKCLMNGGVCPEELKEHIQFKVLIDNKKSSSEEEVQELFVSPNSISFGDGLYKYINNNKIIERVGIYYSQDVEGGNPGLIEAQKTEQRVISYTTKK